MNNVMTNTVALAALKAARQFIVNGTALGFIRLPDADTPDPAHDTLPMIERAISDLEAACQEPRAVKTECVQVAEIVEFGFGLKEVSWVGGKMPEVGTRLYICPELPSILDLSFEEAQKVECELPPRRLPSGHTIGGLHFPSQELARTYADEPLSRIKVMGELVQDARGINISGDTRKVSAFLLCSAAVPELVARIEELEAIAAAQHQSDPVAFPGYPSVSEDRQISPVYAIPCRKYPVGADPVPVCWSNCACVQHQGRSVVARVCGYTPGMGMVEFRLEQRGPLPSWLELGERVAVVETMPEGAVDE